MRRVLIPLLAAALALPAPALAQGQPFDRNGDGVIDSTGVDSNGDGVIDVIGWTAPSGDYVVVSDPNGDNIVNTAAIDFGHDGRVEMAITDLDANGELDTALIDTNGDALPEAMLRRRPGSETFDIVSLSLPGTATAKIVFFDGYLTGSLDTAAVDSDQDGSLDVEFSDNDGDGLYQNSSVLLDPNFGFSPVSTPDRSLVIDLDYAAVLDKQYQVPEFQPRDTGVVFPQVGVDQASQLARQLQAEFLTKLNEIALAGI